MNSSTNEDKVTRRQTRINIIVILICTIAFIGVVALAIYSMQHDSEQLTVYAKAKVPYDQVENHEVVYMQKEYNKQKDYWDIYKVDVYSYKMDGIPGIYVICDELNYQMDFYGFSDYEVLTTYNKFDHGENSKDNPSFNIILKDMSGDKDNLYIHPNSETQTFMLVQ